MKHIYNTDETLDSRDIIQAADEVRAHIEKLKEAIEERREALGTPQEKDDLDGKITSLKEELMDFESDSDNAALLAFVEEAEGEVTDWQFGATLIHASYMETYLREMLEDCGDIPRNLPSYIVIDWEATCEHLKADYSSIDFGGEEYFYRN